MTDTPRPCVRGCLRPRNHLTACPDREKCRGCEPREAEYGDLCWPCHRRLELMLVDFPTVVDWLEVNAPRAGSQRLKEDHHKQPKADAPPTPLDESVLDLREQISSSLAGWVDALVERTSLTGPPLTQVGAQHGARRRQDVTAEVSVTAGYLRTHLTAVENQDFVATMWDELGWLSTDAHALAPWRPVAKPLTGVPCPSCHTAALVIFGGDVDVTCCHCREIIPEDRFPFWVQLLAQEEATA